MELNEESSCATEFVISEKTEFNADSVEWCPFLEFSQYLTCGTYQLNEGETPADDIQTRDGSIALYCFLNNLDGGCSELEKVDVVQSGGVLDLKWCPELLSMVPVLGAACSNGKILLLQLSTENESARLLPLTSFNLSVEEKKMVLSLDWACQNKGLASVIASDTKGNLNYLSVRESELCLLKNWNAHSFESWIAAFNYSQPHIVYSGGDDCRLKGWDTRNLSSAIFINKRHSMGVTSISKSKLNEHLLVTGSYDETVYLWDVRSMKTPLSEISLNGGIWRLKWHPYNPTHLLSASMHNGFHVLSIENCNLKLEAHYDKHESLAYGVDWSFQSNQDKNQKILKSQEMHLLKGNVSSLIASCSFYDKLMHIWKINI
ncbi:diphthine methyltransferase [Trichonephila inaurata madagascariensis]|uniref:methylated diphthine methylhydrolase n=1 Tax=Trichonephila inaurata madagascariensis TaxID=2747483 RepID=A0A8X6Y572_9ARAC|nr:diphthine methyltransferase [Trichonephila inaurata madagascariensis]